MKACRSSRPAFFSLLVFVCNWWSNQHQVDATLVNVTVDDTDPSIVYQPSGSWHASSVPCSVCLNPNATVRLEAWQQTWHDGTHIVPTSDADDFPSSSASSPQTSSPPTPPPPKPTSVSPSILTPTAAPDPDAPGPDTDNDPDDSSGNKGKGGKRDLDNPFEVSKIDSDDPGFVDTPVTAQFNFTGSAIYLYCIQPLGVAAANATPTFMNLTFSVDGARAGSFISNGSPSLTGFQPGVNVFAQENLTDTPHSLQVNVEDDSVFLFDYMIYTQTQNNTSTTSSASGIPSASGVPSINTNLAEKHHNIATFGGAVGGSFGVLSVFCFGLAFSIYRRRRLAARRDRRELEALHTNDPEDSPPMQGPAPFVPRYFPGTTPTAPPPYVPRASMSSPTPLLYHPSEPLSYADRPPATPPPLDDLPLTVPPPPFGVAIATPAPALLSNLIPLVVPHPVRSLPYARTYAPDSDSESDDHTHTPPSSRDMFFPPSVSLAPRTRPITASAGSELSDLLLERQRTPGENVA